MGRPGTDVPMMIDKQAFTAMPRGMCFPADTKLPKRMKSRVSASPRYRGDQSGLGELSYSYRLDGEQRRDDPTLEKGRDGNAIEGLPTRAWPQPAPLLDVRIF